MRRGPRGCSVADARDGTRLIEAARLVLRPPVAGDLGWLVANLNTPAVTAYVGGVRTPEAVADGMADNIDEWARTGRGYWMIVLRDTGAIAGKCGWSSIDDPSAPPAIAGALQVGWSLAEPYWGKSIAFDAARAVISHVFAHERPAAIYAQTTEWNRASTRLIERLGFIRQAHLDYIDPEYPAYDNPTTIHAMDLPAWEAMGG